MICSNGSTVFERYEWLKMLLASTTDIITRPSQATRSALSHLNYTAYRGYDRGVGCRSRSELFLCECTLEQESQRFSCTTWSVKESDLSALRNLLLSLNCFLSCLQVYCRFLVIHSSIRICFMLNVLSQTSTSCLLTSTTFLFCLYSISLCALFLAEFPPAILLAFHLTVFL